MKFRYSTAALALPLSVQRKLRQRLAADRQGSVKILLYHAVPLELMGRFRQHMEALRAHYPFITPDQFHSFTVGELKVRGLHLLITFDDGYKSSKVAAQHVLNPLGIKAVFFITAGYIGLSSDDRWKPFLLKQLGRASSTEAIGPEFEPMSWDDAGWLVDQGHAIGSHGLTHARLSTQVGETKEAVAEVLESADLLEKRLGQPITDFAFPYGRIQDINPSNINLIRQRYAYCYSAIRGLNRPGCSPWSILRDSISVDDPVGYLRFQVENGLGPLYASRAQTLRTMAELGAKGDR